VGEVEQDRFDFGIFNELSAASEARLLRSLEAALPQLDIVIINQQMISGICTESLRRQLNELAASCDSTLFIVDSRDFNDEFTGVMRKLNEHEAMRSWQGEHDLQHKPSLAELSEASEELYLRWQQPIFITRGERGILVKTLEQLDRINGIQRSGQLDSVGAGDSALAAIAAALAAGAPAQQASALGNLAAAVTVCKLRTTGTANPQEILALQQTVDYLYEPEKAEDRRLARYAADSEIEIVSAPVRKQRIRYAIFDHDGTLSTLREGWEEIMQPVMVQAILGVEYERITQDELERVAEKVHEFIDITAGVQTLVQMQGLVEIVREMGYVPSAEIGDAQAYKKIYNDKLMATVNERIGRLQAGRLHINDITLKGAPEFLEALREAGVKLYLVSGTDEDDVVREAAAQGYGHLFEGRVYGAVGDVQREAKREVLDRILSEIGAERAGELVAFGDGPMEIRETRRRGGLCVGIASDEVRRYGWNEAKRSRLIRAGAHMIVPDFSELDRLMDLLIYQ
jgi:phosphoglycolate phosphatase-like HAD superfamily hydrolase